MNAKDRENFNSFREAQKKFRKYSEFRYEVSNLIQKLSMAEIKCIIFGMLVLGIVEPL